MVKRLQSHEIHYVQHGNKNYKYIKAYSRTNAVKSLKRQLGEHRARTMSSGGRKRIVAKVKIDKVISRPIFSRRIKRVKK